MSNIPNDETGDALRQFLANGWDLSKPMEIDFFVAVPSQESGASFAAKAQELGFQTSVEEDEKTKEWTCYCTKVMVPTHSGITQIENQLNLEAQPFDGYIDGFGSYGES